MRLMAKSAAAGRWRWNLLQAVYSGASFSVGTQDGIAMGVDFKTDGTKMYVAGQQNQKVYQFSLGTAWDLATASSDSVSLTNADIVLDGVAFNNDGTKIFLVAFNDQKIYQYSLSAWNLATATYDNIAFSVSAQESWPRGIRFSSDGARAYVVGNFTDTVYQYRC